jgi:3'-phosphoadenosine 5'-phosphosulfate (PAPS) 3'-phosphatase
MNKIEVNKEFTISAEDYHDFEFFMGMLKQAFPDVNITYEEDEFSPNCRKHYANFCMELKKGR